ncbi:galactokinase [Cephaloticoccus primus]|uniref:Galactokinase n=1 Tax=Cephaloticoccus primus TaxID=1548207 RepID=A0A139STW4_9BACT|nr:galactokinase [Cephaloticoccus primus]KXU37881.1 galactokinase [Cephaloticoccus primus]
MRAPLLAHFHAAFGREPAVIARAPGRIEFIGNHIDYNGGTVIGAAIDRSLWVGLAPRDDGRRRFAAAHTGGAIVELPADRVARQSGPADWVNYPLGVLAAFPKFGLRAPAGFELCVVSDLPVGAGLSSSAALELAAALAFLDITQQQVAREQLVAIGRHAENHFVGVPCGILDQGVCGFGRKGHLVFIDCRAPRFELVPLPGRSGKEEREGRARREGDARFWIFNTHTKHALIDGLYAERHRECQEAARALGVAQLAELSPETSAARRAKAHLAPEIARRAQHVVEEIARVEAVRRALARGDLRTTGELLTASHRSSQHLFENSTPELDFLVDTLCTTPGVYGARLSGGGFGGAVIALTDAHFTRAQAETVAARYTARFGNAPEILETQTADGAQAVPASIHAPATE